MLNNDILRDASNRISQLLPMASGIREEVESGIQEILQGAFSRLNLVSREEFDTQLKVLKKAEQTIAVLEEKITALEQTRHVNHPDEENEKQ